MRVVHVGEQLDRLRYDRCRHLHDGLVVAVCLVAATSSTASSATSTLAGFIAAARRMDADLSTAADSINGGIGATTITISDATAAAVKAADPGLVAAALPAGLDLDLLRVAIVVYSELVSRRDAMTYFAFPGSYDRLPSDTSVAPNADQLITCLGHGSQAAADFPADLRALEQLAASRPRPASSRAAAEVAVLVSLVDLTNGCSDQCGGEVMRELPTITWTTDPAGASTATGTFSGDRTEADFDVTFRSGAWQAKIHAC